MAVPPRYIQKMALAVSIFQMVLTYSWMDVDRLDLDISVWALRSWICKPKFSFSILAIPALSMIRKWKPAFPFQKYIVLVGMWSLLTSIYRIDFSTSYCFHLQEIWSHKSISSHRGLKLDGAIGQGEICNSLKSEKFSFLRYLVTNFPLTLSSI